MTQQSTRINSTELLDTAQGLRQVGDDPGLYDAALSRLVSMLDRQLFPLQVDAPLPDPGLRGIASTVGAHALHDRLNTAHGVAAQLPALLQATREAALSWRSNHAQTAPAAPAAATLPASILIIDDQPAVLHALRAVLKDNYRVLMATNGADGIRLFQQQRPDLVLLDMEMPGMGGLQVARTLLSLQEDEQVPVIFVTGHNDTDEETACWEAGAVDFISKPVNPVTLSHRVRTHLAFKRQAELLRQQAYLDGLTGLPNRRCFDERLAIEVRRSLRHNTPLSLLLADVDHFKLYNDHYGHPAGDVCLQQVATAFRTVAERAGDLPARIGGEDFALLLPATDTDGAERVASRLLEQVRALALPHAASSVAEHVTISIGGLAGVAPAAGGAGLLHAADRQLYAAKHGGRNRIVLANALP